MKRKEKKRNIAKSLTPTSVRKPKPTQSTSPYPSSQVVLLKALIKVFYVLMASSSISSSIFNQPHSALRIKFHGSRYPFNLKLLASSSKPRCTSIYRLHHTLKRTTLSLKFSRSLSQSFLPLSTKTEIPSLHHFIAHAQAQSAATTTSEAQVE